jgi:hypothetical protein
MKNILLATVALFLLSSCNNEPAAGGPGSATTDSAAPTAGSSSSSRVQPDPLPSWTEGPLKQSLLTFVRQAADSAGSNFIPVAYRIATFDNDGTLWAEKPYVQELFAFYRVKQMVGVNPALAKKQPFKAVMEKDKTYFAKGGDKALIQLVAATHTGMTEDQFEQSVAEFFPQARVGPRTIPQIVYQPQLELLNYLRANGFKTFICTGGTIELVRGIAQQLYGIPKEQVIGTTFKYKFIDSNRTIIREQALDHFNDKEGKPVGIQEHIGRRPVFACGNEGGAGDIAMLKYCQSNSYPSFQLLINHDDSTREFYYQEKDNASLQAAATNNWHVVSMKNDWKTIYVTK